MGTRFVGVIVCHLLNDPLACFRDLQPGYLTSCVNVGCLIAWPNSNLSGLRKPDPRPTISILDTTPPQRPW
jgi:hypothetical protein